MGIFDDAGIGVEDIPNDPYGFGNDFWTVEVMEVKPADISKSGKQYGTMIKFRVVHPAYEYMWENGLGSGNWLRLPPPPYVRETAPQITWDKDGEQEKKAIFRIGQLFRGLGIPVDQWNSIDVKDLTGKRAKAKIKPKQDDEGFWKFNIIGLQPLPADEGNGSDEFTPGGQSNGGGGGSNLSGIEAALAKANAADDASE